MYKKLLSICLSIAVIFGIIAVFGGCGTDKSISGADSVEELELIIIKYVEDETTDLNTQLTKLMESVNTYDKYLEKIDEVEAFYEEVCNTSELISIRIREYSVEYAEMLIESDSSTTDLYNDFGDMYDFIDDEVADKFYDGILDGIIEDLKDAFYDGVIYDGMNSVSYSEWYEICSEDYALWYDTGSDCYEYCSDMLSDVYSFIANVQIEVLQGDIDGAKEEIADFKEDIEKLKA